MATRSTISKVHHDGTVISVYCHWDGYLVSNGRLLLDHYATEEKVDALLELGNLSSLKPEVGKKHSFDAPTPGWTVAYGRDRGEKGQYPVVYPDIAAFVADEDSRESFNYVWQNGRWYLLDGRDFTLLAPLVVEKENEPL